MPSQVTSIFFLFIIFFGASHFPFHLLPILLFVCTCAFFLSSAAFLPFLSANFSALFQFTFFFVPLVLFLIFFLVLVEFTFTLDLHPACFPFRCFASTGTTYGI